MTEQDGPPFISKRGETAVLASFKRRYGFVGEALANVLTLFSHDLVGIVSDFAREARWVKSIAGEESGSFRLPTAVAVTSDGKVLIVHTKCVSLYDANGLFLLTFAIGGVSGDPCCIAIDSRPGGSGATFITDRSDNSVHVFDQNYARVHSFRCCASSSPRHLSGIAIDSQGQLVVTEFFSGIAQMRRPDGSLVREFCCKRDDDVGGSELLDVAINASHQMVICDARNGIKVFDDQGSFLRKIGGSDSTVGELDGPQGVAYDHAGNILVADTGNHRVLAFKPDGSFLFSLGTGDRERPFDSPLSICVDGQGQIYVLDENCVSVWIV